MNFTHDLISKSGRFAVAVLADTVTFDLIKGFGMRSGRDCDKFEGVPYAVAKNGCRVPREGIIGWFEMKVEKTVDFGSHTMFVASVTGSEVTDEKGRELTYAYYHSNVKPKPAPAPAADGGEVWVCRICGYVHRGPLPRDFVCPVCKHGAQDFERSEIKTVGSSADEIKENNTVWKGEKIMAKFRCTVCGYVHEGPEAPRNAPSARLQREVRQDRRRREILGGRARHRRRAGRPRRYHGRTESQLRRRVHRGRHVPRNGESRSPRRLIPRSGSIGRKPPTKRRSTPQSSPS